LRKIANVPKDFEAIKLFAEDVATNWSLNFLWKPSLKKEELD
jgi:hypothetical protein